MLLRELLDSSKKDLREKPKLKESDKKENLRLLNTREESKKKEKKEKPEWKLLDKKL